MFSKNSLADRVNQIRRLKRETGTQTRFRAGDGFVSATCPVQKL